MNYIQVVQEIPDIHKKKSMVHILWSYNIIIDYYWHMTKISLFFPAKHVVKHTSTCKLDRVDGITTRLSGGSSFLSLEKTCVWSWFRPVTPGPVIAGAAKKSGILNIHKYSFIKRKVIHLSLSTQVQGFNLNRQTDCSTGNNCLRNQQMIQLSYYPLLLLNTSIELRCTLTGTVVGEEFVNSRTVWWLLAFEQPLGYDFTLQLVFALGSDLEAVPPYHVRHV